MAPKSMCMVSFVLMTIDLWVAIVLASHGDTHFVIFTVLAILMWAQGLYYQSKIGE